MAVFMDLLKVSASIYTFFKNLLQSMVNKCIKEKKREENKEKRKKRKDIENKYITCPSKQTSVILANAGTSQIKKMLIVP